MSTRAQHRPFRFILLGDSGVGKTSLIVRLVEDTFADGYRATIATEKMFKDMEVDGKLYTLDLVDTAGQERFQSICRSFYRGAHFCFLTFALDNAKSFHRLHVWKTEFLNVYHESSIRNNSGLPFILIGNKADTTGSGRVVTETLARKWCAANGDIPYFETSAKNGLNVKAVFTAAVRRVLDFESVAPSETTATELLRKGQKSRSHTGLVDLNAIQVSKDNDKCCG